VTHYAVVAPKPEISAAEFEGKQITIIIESVEGRREQEEGKREKCLLVARLKRRKADEMQRFWIINSTNKQCMAAMFGDHVEAWCGKRITLKGEDTNMGRGIRIHGSPDIDKDIEATIDLGVRKGKHKRTLAKVAVAANTPTTVTKE
jgi:hypothetical protein